MAQVSCSTKLNHTYGLISLGRNRAYIVPRNQNLFSEPVLGAAFEASARKWFNVRVADYLYGGMFS